jgi:large subunit ribosomal protein L31e
MGEEKKKKASKTEDEKKEEAIEVEDEPFADSLEKEMEEEGSKRSEEIAGAEEIPSKTKEETVEEKPLGTEEEGMEEEKEKPRREKKAEEEEEVVEEKTYTVPLSKAWIMPANKRAPRAMRILRDYVVKHMKLKEPKQEEGAEEEEPASLIISNDVNEKVWSRGIEKPPRNIRVRAAKDKDGNVTVYLAEGD